MGTGGAVAGFMAVVVARRREEIFRRFREREAVSSVTARTPEELGLAEGRFFRLQVRKGALVESSPGRFHLDESAVARQARLRRWILAVLAALLVSAVVSRWAG